MILCFHLLHREGFFGFIAHTELHFSRRLCSFCLFSGLRDGLMSNSCFSPIHCSRRATSTLESTFPPTTQHSICIIVSYQLSPRRILWLAQSNSTDGNFDMNDLPSSTVSDANAPARLSGAPMTSYSPMWSHHSEVSWDTYEASCSQMCSFEVLGAPTRTNHPSWGP